MGGLPALDLGVIVVYFLAITAFGASFGRGKYRFWPDFKPEPAQELPQR